MALLLGASGCGDRPSLADGRANVCQSGLPTCVDWRYFDYSSAP
jgi:hypothetical protein